MENTCSLGMRCCWMSVAMVVGWWLLASALLWLTWNRVICELTKVKKARFVQSLLLVATLIVFMATPAMMHKKMGCCKNRCSHSAMSGDSEHCPYSGKKNVEAPAQVEAGK